MMKKVLVMAALSLLMQQPAVAKQPGDEGHKGGAAQSDLPKGLQKKGKLPPGWERKLNKGDRLDDELYSHAVPLSKAETAKLPPAPSGTIQVRIESQVLQLDAATRRIREVLRLP